MVTTHAPVPSPPHRAMAGFAAPVAQSTRSTTVPSEVYSTSLSESPSPLGELKVTKPPAAIVAEDGVKACGEKLSSDVFQPLRLTAVGPVL